MGVFVPPPRIKPFLGEFGTPLPYVCSCDIRVFNSEQNLSISSGAIRWMALSQHERDAYARMANEENRKSQGEKEQKGYQIATYPYKGPLGSTGPYDSFTGRILGTINLPLR